MTIDSSYAAQKYVPDTGPTPVYTFEFEVLNVSDIFVSYLDSEGVKTPVDPAEYDIVLDTSLPTAQGGTITFANPHPGGTAFVAVERNTELTQLLDYAPYTPFPANSHELGLDKLTLIVQEQAERLNALEVARPEFLGPIFVTAIDPFAGDSLHDRVGAYEGQSAYCAGYFATRPVNMPPHRWDPNSEDTPIRGFVVQPRDVVGPGRWILKADTHVDPAWAGADPINVPGSADAWQAAADFADFAGVQMIRFTGRHTIERTVTVNIGISIEGNNPDSDIIQQTTGNNYYDVNGDLVAANQGGFTFFLNIDPANPNTWIQQFPNTASGAVRKVQFSGALSGGGNFIYFAGGYTFEDFRADNAATLIRKPNLYTDHVKISRIHHQDSRQNDTDFLIYLPGLGDGLFIDDVSPGYVSAETRGTPTMGIYITLCRGGHIRNLINGWHVFVGSGGGLTLTNGHFESGGYELDSCDVVVRDNLFFTEQDGIDSGKYGVLIKDDNALTAGSRRTSIIEHNEFTRSANRRGGWPSVDAPDIRFASAGAGAYIENNERSIFVSGQNSRQQKMCALVGFAGGISQDWANYAHVLTREGVFVTADTVPVNGSVQRLLEWNGWAAAEAPTIDFSAEGWVWTEASGTYYYGVQMLADPVRLIGSDATGTTPETSASTTLGGEIIVPQVLRSVNTNSNLIYRLYRGTSSGVYDKYVDIPAQSVYRFYDEGKSVNGFPWIDRTPGPVVDLNYASVGNSLEARYCEGNVELKIINSANNPTEGTWKQGDLWRRTDIMSPGVGNTTIAGGYYNGSVWIREALQEG